MKIYLAFLFCIGICACGENKSNQVHTPGNTGTIVEPSFDKKNAFLSRPEIGDTTIQTELFLQVQGLWHFDKITRIEDEEILEKDFEDMYFMERMAFPLDYPCSWPHKRHGERVYMTKDSIFFSSDGFTYLNENRYEIQQDTLLIYGTTANDRDHWIEYYSRREYDSEIIDSLNATGFNKECLSGTWTLVEIFDDKMEGYKIKDELFNYIPKQIEMAEYQIQGNLIFLEKDPSVKFKIASVRRLNKDFGSGFSIWLEDIEPTAKGFCYIYHPE